MAFRLGWLLLAWVFCAPFCEVAHAGITTSSGREPCYWLGTSVVVVEITDIALDRRYYVRFTPLVTLAGNFDCAAMGEQSVALVYGQFVSCLVKLPRSPGFAVVVLARTKDAYYITGEISTYMPEGYPVCQIDSLGAKEIESITANVHARRPESDRNQIRERSNCNEELKGAYLTLEEAALRKPKGNASIPIVVYAEVASITPENDTQKVKLRLLGTVAGKLDAALVQEIELTVTAEQLDGHTLPEAGAKVFVALNSEKEDAYQLADDNDFMPSKWSICTAGENPNDATSQCLRIWESLQTRFEKE